MPTERHRLSYTPVNLYDDVDSPRGPQYLYISRPELALQVLEAKMPMGWMDLVEEVLCYLD